RINGLLQFMEAPLPAEVVLHPSADPDRQIQQMVNALSWRMAGYEAVWGLIHANILLPASSQFSGGPPQIRWTTVVPGEGGTTSSWTFDTLAAYAPKSVILAPSYQGQTSQPLADPDLYLHEINIPNLPLEMERALREAVLCFKQELFTA